MADPGVTVTMRAKAEHQFNGVTRLPGDTYEVGLQYVELLELVGHAERVTPTGVPSDVPRLMRSRKDKKR